MLRPTLFHVQTETDTETDEEEVGTLYTQQQEITSSILLFFYGFNGFLCDICLRFPVPVLKFIWHLS